MSDFLTDDNIKMLVISTNNAGDLVPTFEFSSTAKGKVIYFIRKQFGPIPKESVREVISCAFY